MRKLILCTVALAALVCPARGQQPITQADLLRRVIDLNRLTTPPAAGERTAMFSSYDRASRIDAAGNLINWGANADAGQFIRKEADGWDVMAEMSGPGAITRVWSANPHGDIRFILDGQVVIDMPFAELMSGKRPPFEEPFVYRGLNCYFPLGYGASCKVVCRNSGAYYQINYVQFPPPAQVELFKFELDEAAQAALADVKAALENGLSDKQLFGDRKTLSTGVEEAVGKGTLLTEKVDGAGTVRALYVGLTDRAAPRELYALHKCVLRVFVDGESTPSVEAPLIDFFGSGFDLLPVNSLPIGTNKELRQPLLREVPTGPDKTTRPAAREQPWGGDRYLYCYFPMPFRNGLRVEIENLSAEKTAIGLLLHMRVDTQPPAPDALRFYAHFRKEDPCAVFDNPILEATGRGRIVGCVLNVDCPRAAWWGEGDDKLWIDGEQFPSYFGTGSEDYLSDAWGLHWHIRPLQGVSRTGPYGKNSAYRWHINDSINFQQSVRFTIENYAIGDAQDTYYGTVAYWYAAPGCRHFFAPLTAADLAVPGLRIPGAIEVEDHIAGDGWGQVAKEKYADGAEYSGGLAASISTDPPVQINIPSTAAQTVRLKLRVNPRRPFETIAVTDAAGRTLGTVTYNRDAQGVYDVGTIRLEKGDNAVKVQCSKPAILDCWILEGLPRFAHGPEAEDLKVVSAGHAKVRPEYAALPWSAGGQLAMDFSAVGYTVTLALPEQRAETFALLGLVVTTGPNGGRFQTLLDGQPVGEPVDCRGEEPPAIKRLKVGTVSLAKGAHTLGFRAVEGAAKPDALRLGLDGVDFMPVYSPYAREAEDMKVVAAEGCQPARQDIGGTSADAHLWCRPKEAGAWVELETPVAAAGRYKLSVAYLKSFDYGIVQAYVNGAKTGEPVDLFSPHIAPKNIIELGTFDLPAAPLRLKVEVTGKNGRSGGYFFGVDCVILEPL
jgi:hypothetical protein